MQAIAFEAESRPRELITCSGRAEGKPNVQEAVHPERSGKLELNGPSAPLRSMQNAARLLEKSLISKSGRTGVEWK